MTTLLLAHAWPLDASMWDEQVAALKGEVEVLAPSFPGFGGTPPAGETVTMEAMANSLVAELDRAGAARAVVCGLSIGGYVTFALWRLHRERIAGLVLADTRAEADDQAGKDRRRTVAETVKARGSEWMAENPPPLLSDGTDPALWGRVKEIIRRQPAHAIAAAALGMAERTDSRPILSEIDVPTAVIVGSADALTTPEMSQTIADGIPRAELTVLEGAGHLSNLEEPEGFAEAIRKLLRRVS
ncbi:MAG: alpha/beta fold hydrolase [Actinomycetota bacterium]